MGLIAGSVGKGVSLSAIEVKGAGNEVSSTAVVEAVGGIVGTIVASGTGNDVVSITNVKVGERRERMQ